MTSTVLRAMATCVADELLGKSDTTDLKESRNDEILRREAVILLVENGLLRYLESLRAEVLEIE